VDGRLGIKNKNVRPQVMLMLPKMMKLRHISRNRIYRQMSNAHIHPLLQASGNMSNSIAK
jgi:hypothetical protein